MDISKLTDYGTFLREREAMALEERAKGIRDLADTLTIRDTFTKSDRDRMYQDAAQIESTARELRQQNFAAEMDARKDDSNAYIFRTNRDYRSE